MVLVLACAGITATAAAAQTAVVHPTVKPRMGKSKTRFVVSFRPPQSAVLVGVTQVHYVVAAGLRSHRGRCVSSVSSAIYRATAGTMVHIKLSPKGANRRWCTGRFHGKIQEFVSNVCGCPGPGPPGMICEIPCPAAAILPVPQTIGTFSFRVRK